MIVKFSSDTAMAEFTEALDYHGIPFDCQGATVHLIAPNDATLTLADALGGAVVKDDGFVDTAAFHKGMEVNRQPSVRDLLALFDFRPQPAYRILQVFEARCLSLYGFANGPDVFSRQAKALQNGKTKGEGVLGGPN